MYIINHNNGKTEVENSQVESIANAVQTSMREFKLHDVSEQADVNGILEQLNVGEYSTQSLNHVCQGFKLIKDDQGEPLTIVSSTYDLLQPLEAFAFLDCLKDELSFSYEKAGFLQNGKQLFVQGSLGNFEVPTSSQRRKGDILNKRIVAKTSFDGSIATTIAIEILRVWCDNGCASWESDNAIAKVKHTRNQRQLMRYALEQATGVKQVIQNLESDIATLSNVDVNQEQFNRINELVFKGESKRAENVRDQVASQFHNERLGAFGESAWDVLNAFTAYQTHDRVVRETKQTSREENAFRAQGDQTFSRKVRKAIQEVLSV